MTAASIERIAELERVADLRRRIVGVVEHLGVDELEAAAIVLDDLARGAPAEKPAEGR
jgi:hypothetical protein